MICRFIEQQNVRRLHQSLNNRETLLPASGELARLHIEILKSGAAQRLSEKSSALRLWHGRKVQSIFDHRANRIARLEFRLLLDEAEAEALANGHFSRVGAYTSCQDPHQRGFSRSIRTDEPDAVALRNRKRDILKKGS